MNKTEFIERMAQEAGGPKSEAQRYFDAFESVITSALKSGDEVRITGFGKFYAREQKAREGVNRRPRRGCTCRPAGYPPSARARPDTVDGPGVPFTGCQSF